MIIEKIDGALFKEALKGSMAYLESKKEEINALNVFPVPDGDTGTNMYLTVKSAVKHGLETDSNSVGEIANKVSGGSLMGARGNSGVILSQIFRGFAAALKDVDVISVENVAKGFKLASETAYKAVMKPTEGTILTVARECGEYAMRIAKQETDIISFLEKVLAKGEEVLEKTPEMLPVLKEAGVVDAGGKGLLVVIKGALLVLKGESFDVDICPKEVHVEKERIKIETDDIEFGYCTEFMINTNYDKVESFRDMLSTYGDSLIVVAGDGIIKVHVHTNNPGEVVEKALELGFLTDIKIDNMRFQHHEILLKDELEAMKKKEELEKYAVISICVGDGVKEIFKDLSADYIVSGGQTMNPSTEDILAAIEETNGENVFILPNNSNIILTANQAKELSERNVIVIPTKTIPQGISAILQLDRDKEIEEIEADMLEAIEGVKTGQITYSVRDTTFNGDEIKKGDIIGIFDSNIVAKGNDINEVSVKLLDIMIDEESSIISIIKGEEIEDDVADSLEKILDSKYEDISVEMLEGKQPIYYYIISVE